MKTIEPVRSPDRTGAAMASPPRTPRWQRRAVRVIVVLTALALAGAGLQTLAERRHAAAHPAPGEHVGLADGRRLHVQVAGEKHDGPTVLLLGGAGASVSAWGWLLPAVAEHATVVAYDRAGLGWSDPSDAGTGADAVLADLRQALEIRGLDGPYVLVGHSLGGHYARAFAAAHPDEVSGLVLVDPSHEDQAKALGMSSASAAPMFTALRELTRLGLTRLYLPPSFTHDLTYLPQPERDQALGQMLAVGYWRTFGAEMAGLDDVGASLPTGRGAVGDIPLHVLIATGGATSENQQEQVGIAAELRRTMEELSSTGRTTVLPDASHVSIVTERAHAEIIADAIVEQVEAAR